MRREKGSDLPLNETTTRAGMQGAPDGGSARPSATAAPQISTLIPTFQRAAVLRRALRSVLSQSHPFVQACVFDNASTDETEAVVREAMARDPRILYHRHPTNIGATLNFQHALRSVDTPFFSILSDDDILLPGFYAAAIEEFERHPEAAMVCLDVYNLTAHGDLVREKAMTAVPDGRHAPPSGLLAMVAHVPTTWTGIVFRRRVADELGPLDVETGAGSDVDYILRAAARWPFVLRHQPGAVFVPVSIAAIRSSRGSVSAFWPGWLKIVRNLSEDGLLPAEAREQMRAGMLARLWSYLFVIGAAAAVRGDLDETARAAALLRDEAAQPGRSLLLRALEALCRLPGAHAALRCAFSARAWLRHARHAVGRRLSGRPTPWADELKI